MNMKNEKVVQKMAVLEASTRNPAEERLATSLNTVEKDNQAKVLTFANTLVMANANIDKEALYAIFVKNYILNRLTSKVEPIREIDFIYGSLKRDESFKTSKETAEFYNFFANVNMRFLVEYIEMKDKLRYKLASSYVANMNNVVKVDKIDEKDLSTCLEMVNNLNEIIESSKVSRDKNNKALYRSRKYDDDSFTSSAK